VSRIFGALTAAALAALTPANGATSAVERNSNEPTPAAIQMLHKLATCFVEKSPDTWRRLLAMVPGSTDERDLLLRMIDAAGERCMQPVTTATRLSGQSSVFRGPLAEAIWKKAYRDGRKPAKAIAPFGIKAALVSTDLTSKSRTALLALTFGECVLASDGRNAVALLETEPASVGEKAVFDRLQPALAPCLPQGNTLKLSYVILRGVLAEVVYRQAAGEPFPLRATD